MENGVLGKQILRHEKFCIVGNPLKHEWHQFVIAVACSHHQQPVSLLLGINRNRLAAQQVKYFLLLQRQVFINMPLFGFLQNLRLRKALHWADRTNHGITVHIHESKRTKPVEPDIGHPLNHRILGSLGNLLLKIPDSSLLLTNLDTIPLKNKFQPRFNLFHQLPSGRLCKFFQFIGIHVLTCCLFSFISEFFSLH